MSFEKQKKDCLERIDKSNKGGIDKDIKSLIDLINSKKDYYTTSSCSGRILLIEKRTDKKQDARFVFAQHKKAVFNDIKNSLKVLPKNDLWLKEESIIIHVCCRDEPAAIRFLKIVRDLGIKRAGIINLRKRIIIEIIGTESMETIIARDGKMIVSDDYLKIIIREANKKLQRNKKKIKELYRFLIPKIIAPARNITATSKTKNNPNSIIA
jgi:tRNA wybutosine-synthesizing protein 3